MLAEGLEGNAPGQDELVIAFVVGEGGEVEVPRGEQLGVRLGYPPGCLDQVLRGRVVAQGDEQVPDRLLGRVQIEGLLLPGDPQAARTVGGSTSTGGAGQVVERHRAGPGRKALARRASVRAPSSKPKSRRAMS